MSYIEGTRPQNFTHLPQDAYEYFITSAKSAEELLSFSFSAIEPEHRAQATRDLLYITNFLIIPFGITRLHLETTDIAIVSSSGWDAFSPTSEIGISPEIYQSAVENFRREEMEYREEPYEITLDVGGDNPLLIQRYLDEVYEQLKQLGVKRLIELTEIKELREMPEDLDVMGVSSPIKYCGGLVLRYIDPALYELGVWED